MSARYGRDGGRRIAPSSAPERLKASFRNEFLAREGEGDWAGRPTDAYRAEVPREPSAHRGRLRSTLGWWRRTRATRRAHVSRLGRWASSLESSRFSRP